MLVLISKGNADTWGIGMLYIVWKVAEAVIDTCIKSLVQFYDVVHRFCAGIDTGTNIMEF